MNVANINAVDLNLLRVFDALMEEGNVTRAGVRLGLTQSAISHSLNRLRALMGDELFVRSPRGVKPTPRATEIGPGVHAALLQLHGAIAPRPFEAASTERTFTIIAGAYSSAVLVPQLVAALASQAPKAGLVIAEATSDTLEELESHRADFVIGTVERAPQRVLVETLIEDTLVWVVRADHPLAQSRLTLARLAATPHVAIRRRPSADFGRSPPLLAMRSSWEDQGILEAELEAAGLTRRIGVTVPDTYSALAVARRSEMAAQIPRRLATLAAGGGLLVMLRPPYRPPDVRLSLICLRERLSDPAVGWMHGLLIKLAASLR